MKKIIAGGGLIFNDKNELLMIFRRGKWDLPKGKLDKGETIETCAVREIKEETGLTVTIVKFVEVTKHEYSDPYSKKEVVKETHWFEMHAAGEQPLIPQTEEDIEKAEWVNDEMIEEKLKNSYKNIAEIINTFKQLL